MIPKGDGEVDSWLPAAITAADEDGNIAIIGWDAIERNPVSDVIEADDDTKVIYVDSNANSDEAKCITDETGYDFVSKPTDDGEYRNINAKYIMDGNKVAFILIDVKGDLDDQGVIKNLAGWNIEDVDSRAVYGTPGKITIKLEAENYYWNPYWSNANLVSLVEITNANGIADKTFTNVIDSYFDKNGDVTVSFESTMATNAGNYVATYKGNGTTVEVPFTVARQEKTGFDLTYTNAPADDTVVAGASVKNLFKDFTVKSNDESDVTYNVTLTAANGELAGRDIIANGDTVKVVVTITPDSNHVFDDDHDGLKGETLTDDLQIAGVKGQKEVKDNGRYMTITYTFSNIGATTLGA